MAVSARLDAAVRGLRTSGYGPAQATRRVGEAFLLLYLVYRRAGLAVADGRGSKVVVDGAFGLGEQVQKRLAVGLGADTGVEDDEAAGICV